MKNMQAIADKTAISLSFLCTLHCLALPLLVISLPTVTALGLVGEAFHLWMLVVVVPVSLVALAMGCKKHNNMKVLFAGIVGLIALIAAGVAGHDLLGEIGEKALTVFGAVCIAVGHFFNHRLCQQQTDCHCHDHTASE